LVLLLPALVKAARKRLPGQLFPGNLPSTGDGGDPVADSRSLLGVPVPFRILCGVIVCAAVYVAVDMAVAVARLASSDPDEAEVGGHDNGAFQDRWPAAPAAPGLPGTAFRTAVVC
jgi:hypothetical protein